jgi:hypothetical protein
MCTIRIIFSCQTAGIANAVQNLAGDISADAQSSSINIVVNCLKKIIVHGSCNLAREI